MPILDNLVSSNAARAADKMDARSGYIFLIIALLALAGFIIGQVWLARRFKRTINVGMLASAAVLLVIALASLIAAIQVSSTLLRVFPDARIVQTHRAQLDHQRQLRRCQHGRGCPDRCQQREVERKPDADRTRIRAGIRDGVEVLG